MANEIKVTDIDNGDVQIIEVANGLKGDPAELITGTAPPSPTVGGNGAVYLVTEGAVGIGDVYRKTGGVWVSRGNIRGPAGAGGAGSVLSVNGKNGDVVIDADDITEGKFVINVIPTGTTDQTVALGNHNHSGVYEPVIAGGTTSTFFRGDRTWQAVTKSDVGLGNVDNTADADKPVSTATQAALNSKAAATHTHALTDSAITGVLPMSKIPTGTTASTVAVGNHTHAISGVIGLQGALDAKESISGSQSKATEAENNAKSYTDTVSAAITGSPPANLNSLAKIAAAIGNNASYSTTVTSALAGKEATIAAGTTSQYWRGDKTWQTLNKAAVGLSNVDNTSDANKPISSATQSALNTKAAATHTHSGADIDSGVIDLAVLPVADLGDNTPGMLVRADDPRLANNGVGAHDHNDLYYTKEESDLILEGYAPTGHTHLVSEVSGLSTALDGKENAIPMGEEGQFLRWDKTWSLPSKNDIGLGAVDNTSDAAKPVSILQADAIQGAKVEAMQYTESYAEPQVSPGTIGQFYRGDKNWANLSTTVLDLNTRQSVIPLKAFNELYVKEGSLQIGNLDASEMTGMVSPMILYPSGMFLMNDGTGKAVWGFPNSGANPGASSSPSEHDSGLVFNRVTNAMGYPVASEGVVLTLKEGIMSPYGFQILSEQGDTAAPRIRVPDSSSTTGWTPWMRIADRTTAKEYVASRGTDLVTNGTGFLKNNTNFSQTVFDNSDAPTGAVGSFVVPVGTTTVFSDELITVDPNKVYVLSHYMKQRTAGGTGRAYHGYAPVDAFGLTIGPQHYMWRRGTTTTLAQALNPGDTVVRLTSSANWTNSAGTSGGPYRSLIFWNYVDPGGKAWPQETYSRNAYVDVYNDGAISGNNITLKTPWAGPSIAAGTKVSNGASGGTYVYGTGLSNVQIPTTWTHYTSSIFTGVHSMPTTVGAAPVASTGAFPHGTAQIRLVFLANRTAAGGVDSTSEIAFAGVSFSDTQGLAKNVYTKAEIDAKFAAL